MPNLIVVWARYCIDNIINCHSELFTIYSIYKLHNNACIAHLSGIFMGKTSREALHLHLWDSISGEALCPKSFILLRWLDHNLITTILCTYIVASKYSSHELTWFLASMSAPASSSIATTSLCPLTAEQCNGVHCCYM